MKKFMRTGISVVAAAAALTAVSAAASAQSIDFEDGSCPSAVYMKTNDGGDLSVLSVVDFNGSKQLKVDVQDCSLIPKVEFNVGEIVGVDNLSKVNKIQLEVTIASKDGETPPGWAGGALGTAGGDNSPAWDQSDWEGGEYENAVSQTILVERKFLLPSKKFVDGTDGSIALLMRWGTEVPYDMYVDNVRFLDSDGNEMELFPAGGAEAAPADEAPADEAPADEAPAATEAPAETAAPAADTAPSAPAATGNAGVASIAAVMALSAAAAFIAKRK